MKMTFEISNKLTEEQINQLDILIQNVIFDFECENECENDDIGVENNDDDADHTGIDLQFFSMLNNRIK